MPEFVNIWFLRRKVRFDQIATILIVALAGYFLLKMAAGNNTGESAVKRLVELAVRQLRRFYYYYNSERPNEREYEWRLFRATNTCHAHFSGADVTQLRPIDWDAFDRNRRYRKTAVWWEPFFVNEKYKVLFCTIPQVASTNLLRYVVKLGFSKTLHEEMEREINAMPVHSTKFASAHLQQLREFDTERAKQILDTFTKVTFVRNPLDRLLSAWYRKLARYDENLTYEFGSKMIRLYRPNATVEEIRKGHPVELREFFEYLANFPLPSRAHDIHWKPMYEVCQFCNIRYDFIGKLEQIGKELRHLTRELASNYEDSAGETSNHFEHALPTLANSVDRFDNKTAYLRQIPQELVEKVIDRQKLDYQFFDYDMDLDKKHPFRTH